VGLLVVACIGGFVLAPAEDLLSFWTTSFAAASEAIAPADDVGETGLFVSVMRAWNGEDYGWIDLRFNSGSKIFDLQSRGVAFFGRFPRLAYKKG